MKIKNILLSILMAIVFITLYFNMENMSFWFFRDFEVSKLAVLGGVYLLGIISGALIFRKRKKVLKTVDLDESIEIRGESIDYEGDTPSSLSREDRDFLSRD